MAVMVKEAEAFTSVTDDNRKRGHAVTTIDHPYRSFSHGKAVLEYPRTSQNPF